MPDEIKTTIYDSFDKVSAVWNWFEQEGDCYAFQSFNWTRNWYELIGKGAGVRAYLVLIEYPKGHPVMLLPLGIQQMGPASCLIWLGGKIADYQGPLLSKNCAETLNINLFNHVWRDVLEKLPEFDAIFFENQPEFIAKQKNPFLFIPCQPHPSSAHFTRIEGDIESFIKQKRSKKSIATERAKQRRLSSKGVLDFIVASKHEEISPILDTMMQQKSESYRKLGVTDLFNQHQYRAFFEYMSEHHIKDSFIHLCALKLDKQILATHWGMVYKKRFYIFMPTYAHDELARYSPGNILLRKIFEWCISNDVEICDFTTGDERYKYHWCDQELKLYDCFQPQTIKGILYVWPTRLQRTLKRKIKHSPTMSKVFFSLRTRISKLTRQ